MSMEKWINKIKQEYKELSEKLTKPSIMLDAQKSSLLTKKYIELKKIMEKIQKLEDLKKKISETELLLKTETDPELIMIAEDELVGLKKQLEKLTKELELAMIPSDPDENKDVIIEIRAGTGGQEAALFAADLFRMYSRYAERKKWKTKLISSSPSPIGGLKEVIFEISGHKVFGHFKYESGVHRVQRIPITEKAGRIHTSTATVAVLPKIEEKEISIKPEELKIETFRASGHGGQKVQKTESAVRITHLPTGLTVSCQDERSQSQNKERAMEILRARLYEMMKEKERKERGEMRRIQIGTGERSEKIRTYNFPQDRITDHRINLTLHHVNEILDGNLDPLISKLKSADLEKKLKLVEKGM